MQNKQKSPATGSDAVRDAIVFPSVGLLCLALSLMTLVGPYSHSQAVDSGSAEPAAQSPSEPSQKQAAERTEPTQTVAPKARNESRYEGVVQPSEKISEDFAVSFPVDI